VRAQRVGVRHDLELSLVTAGRRHLRDPRDGHQPAPDRRVGDRPQRHLVHGVRVVGREGEEEDLAHDRRDGSEHGWIDLGRQVAGHQRQLLGHELPRGIDVGAPVELHPDHRDADRGGRSHATDARGAVDRALDGKGDEGLHLVGRHAVALGEDRDGGRRQVGEDVDRHAAGRPDARGQQQRGTGDDEPVMVDRPGDESLHLGLL